MEALRDLWTAASLEAVEAWEITVHRTFSDFDDFWMTKVKVPSLAPQSPRWHPETSRRSRAGCAHAYRRHRRTDHARSLEYCCLMRDFTEDDATMQERFAMRAPRWKWATQPAPKFFEAQSSLSWRPSSQIRPDGLIGRDRPCRAAKARGVKLGSPIAVETVVAARAARSRYLANANATTRAIIADIQRSGVSSLVEIGKTLEARGVRTPRGYTTWRPVQVWRLLTE